MSWAKRNQTRTAFTLVELLVVVVVICILISLCLPAVRTARGAAQRMQCSNNLKSIGLSLHNYHDVFSHFPSAMGGTGAGGNENRLSGLVALLPYLEQQALWDKIKSPLKSEGVTYPAMGPAPWVDEYPPWREVIPTFNCPSVKIEKTTFGRTNYAFCVGDTTEEIHAPRRLRGAFGCGLISRMSDIKDGQSNTIAMAEIGSIQARAVAGQYAVNQPSGLLVDPSIALRTARSTDYVRGVPLSQRGRGGRWADGAAGAGLVNTVLPPNSPSCAVGGVDAVDGVYSSGSFHPGGTQVVMVDGRVQFIANTINAGDWSKQPVRPKELSDKPIASPYGVWGAMGTANGSETWSDSF